MKWSEVSEVKVKVKVIGFWSFDFPESYIYYSLGIYLNRYKRKMCRTNVLWVCKFGQVGRFLPQISKSPYYDDFFQNWPSQWRSSRVFLRWNFRSDFFLFRFIFKGISLIKLKAISIFWWTFFLVRFIFKGNSHIKFKGISNIGGNYSE